MPIKPWWDQVTDRLEVAPIRKIWGDVGVVSWEQWSWPLGEFTIGVTIGETSPSEASGRFWSITVWGALEARVNIRLTRKPTQRQIIHALQIVGLALAD